MQAHSGGCGHCQVASNQALQHSQVVERLLGQLPHLLIILLSLVTPLLGRIHIRRRLDIGVIQHRYHGQQDGLDSQHRLPPRVALVLIHWVVNTVQDRNADVAVLVDVGVPHGGHKLHFGRIVWEVLREFHRRLEIATFEGGILWAVEDDVPLEHVVVVFQAH